MQQLHPGHRPCRFRFRFRFRFRLRKTSALMLSLFAVSPAWADDVAPVEFDDSFLQQPSGARIDFSRFNKGNVALPGVYRVDLHVNQTWLGRAEITLRQAADATGDARPCFDCRLLDRIGVDVEKLGAEAKAMLLATPDCVALPQLIPEATASFDLGEQRLDIGIPQVAMNRSARGYVDPQYWDEGIPAAQLQYNASTYRAQSAGQSFTQNFLGLNGGVNAGAWRLRHSGNASSGDLAGTRYQSVQTNLSRGIPALRSQLVIGDGFTDGTVFDSVGFRGVQLASDDRMVPESQRGYAPIVRGIANSNARVQVRQNGNVIYETTVAPGPFEIDDLYPTGYGGDLEVVVTEADGRVLVSRVPYAAAVNALRPGVTRYALTAGQFRSAIVHATPMIYQGTVQHGINNLLTGYGGLSATEGYAAVVAGAALNTRFGAFGADVTHARTALQNQPDRDGQSVRLAYTRLLEPTNTSISVAAYRYSSRGYLNMADAVALRALEARGFGFAENDAQKGRLQLVLNQALPQGYGSFFTSASRQNYWNRDGADTQFQVGYSNNHKRLNYGVTAARQFNPASRRWANTVMLTLSVPFGSDRSPVFSTTNFQRDARGGTSVQQALSGSLGEDQAVTYGLNANRDSRGGAEGGSATTVGGNIAYASPVAKLTANASRNGSFTQVGVGASGTVVAYAGGVVLSPNPGDTIAIVEAKDAAGARVSGGSGLQVDRWGHAVVSSLAPFAVNTIDIDPKGLPLNVELKSTEARTVPTAGAVVLVKFETDDAGRAAIIRATDANGAPLPFGVEVFDSAGTSVGSVAQAGRIMARGLKSDSGTLAVRWGEAAASNCSIHYVLPPAARDSAAYTVVDAVCR